MRELLARVKANIRRGSMGAVANVPQMPAADEKRLVIDKAMSVVRKDGKNLDLTQREFDLICFLAAEPGKIFSREVLMERVWNYDGYVGDVRAVDVAVRRLREKLEDDPANPAFIVTKRGMGYYFAG
jgi:two-component system response regulator VicR